MAENVESFKNFEENLELQGDKLDQTPYVIQYNKRDLDGIAPVNYLDFLLNNRAVRQPSFTSVAIDGTGVFETLNMISRLVLHRFVQDRTSKQPAKEEDLVLA